MTHLAPTSDPKPDSIAFGELVIAAGLTGHAVALCLSESAASVDCELLKYFAQFSGPSRVLHVHAQADVTKLRKSFDSWRLVVVHAPRLFNTVVWTVQTHGSEMTARPAVFCRILPESADDVPMPLLALRHSPDEATVFTQWLMMGCPQQAVLPGDLESLEIVLDPALLPVTVPGNVPGGQGPSRLRDCQLIGALLRGATLIGSCEQPEEGTDVLTCGQLEYERVRGLLKSRLVSAADEPVDELALDMLNRANVFLRLKCDPGFYYSHPTLCGPSAPVYRRSGSHTRQDLISRREVADLGNVGCQLIRTILEWLQNQPDGYDRFCRMGLVRQALSEPAFREADVRKLSSILRPWSCKQTRSRFDALRRSGLITGERESGNGPWQFRLPAELESLSSPFGTLPPVEELFDNAATST